MRYRPEVEGEVVVKTDEEVDEHEAAHLGEQRLV